MNKNASHTPIQSFLLFTLASFAISVIYILFYKWYFGFSLTIVRDHLMVVGFLYLSGILFASLMMMFDFWKEKKWIRYVWGLLWGLAILLLCSIYILNYVSLNEWGENISWYIIKTFSSDIPNLVEAIPYNIAPIYILALILPLSIIAGGLYFSSIINKGFIAIGAKIKQLIKRPIFLLLGIILILSGMGYLVLNKTYIRNILAFRGEPIMKFTQRNSTKKWQNGIPLAMVNQHKKAYESYSAPKDFKPKNVVLIMVDALRYSNLAFHGYERMTTPFLASLHEKQQLQKTAHFISNTASSYYGILGTLNGVSINKLGPTNFKLQDLFDRLGYRSHFILTGSHKDWYQLHLVHEHYTKIDYYYEGVFSNQFNMSDDRIILEYLDEIPDYDGTPSFFYMHMLSVHAGGKKESQFNEFKPSGKTSYLKPDSIIMRNNYDNSLLQADDFIRQIYERLEQKGFMEDCLLIITSDHGELLGERGHFGHGKDMYRESLHIPLLFHDTKELAKADLGFGTQTDIAPTILDKLGLEKPSVWDGHSLEQTPELPYFRVLHHFKKYGLILHDNTGIYKYIYNDQSKVEDLFDIKHDPEEANNLIDNPAFLSHKTLLRNKLREEFGIQIQK